MSNPGDGGQNGGGSGPGGVNLGGDPGDLKKFKKRVDQIITDLSTSKAAPTKIGQQEVKRASFGGEFDEAHGLSLAYNQVHTQLTELSKLLGEQIEAMNIAVLAADKGFAGLEEDVQRRFWQLQTRADQYQQRRAAEGNKPPTDHTEQGEF